MLNSLALSITEVLVIDGNLIVLLDVSDKIEVTFLFGRSCSLLRPFFFYHTWLSFPNHESFSPLVTPSAYSFYHQVSVRKILSNLLRLLSRVANLVPAMTMSLILSKITQAQSSKLHHVSRYS
jgi:hypothetical protein